MSKVSVTKTKKPSVHGVGGEPDATMKSGNPLAMFDDNGQNSGCCSRCISGPRLAGIFFFYKYTF